jgi:hypothetical protein
MRLACVVLWFPNYRGTQEQSRDSVYERMVLRVDQGKGREIAMPCCRHPCWSYCVTGIVKLRNKKRCCLVVGYSLDKIQSTLLDVNYLVRTYGLNDVYLGRQIWRCRMWLWVPLYTGTFLAGNMSIGVPLESLTES